MKCLQIATFEPSKCTDSESAQESACWSQSRVAGEIGSSPPERISGQADERIAVRQRKRRFDS
jgi:hypothetical protein